MKNEEMERKIKKFAIYGGVMITAGLTALGVNKINSKNDKQTTPVVTEIPATTEAPITVEESNIDNPEVVENIVEENYTSYQDFYDNQGYTIDDIRNLTLLMNSEYQGVLTSDEVQNALNMSSFLSISDNLIQKIDNINIESKEDCALYTLPNKTELLIDDNTIVSPILNRIYDDINSVVESIQETGSYESVLDQYNKEVVDMCYGTFDKDLGLDTAKITNPVLAYEVATAKCAMLSVAAQINVGKEYITGNQTDEITGEKQKVKINYTSEEQNLEAKYFQAEQDGLKLTDSENDKYIKMQQSMAITEFNNSMCNYSHSLVESAKSYTLK